MPFRLHEIASSNVYKNTMVTFPVYGPCMPLFAISCLTILSSASMHLFSVMQSVHSHVFIQI